VFPAASAWDFQGTTVLFGHGSHLSLAFLDGLQGSPMASIPFWAALICQIIIVGEFRSFSPSLADSLTLPIVGYFWFYRMEQLSRP
jgi:hypothetical protein